MTCAEQELPNIVMIEDLQTFKKTLIISITMLRCLLRNMVIMKALI